MASAIDATKPVAGNPTTESVRANFAAAKSEIEVLQQTAGVGPKGDQGERGPAGTIAVGTVTTGAAGTSATVTNTGSTTAATLNFTIPRGDAGTGGGGITETQAKDAVRQGSVQFSEVPATTAPTWPTTPVLQQPPSAGTGWTPETGGNATQAYTHELGNTGVLAYPAAIANGSFYQIVFSNTNVAATSTVTSSFFHLYFRNGATTTTGQQTVFANVGGTGTTVVVQATASFTHFVVVPVSGWQGNFTLTRIVVFSGDQNSVAFSIKNGAVRARDNGLYIGGGGRFATSANTSFGVNALNLLTSGQFNVAVGENAMARTAAASYCTAVGCNALLVAIGASYNTAIGSFAMVDAQMGQINVAVGGYALGAIRNANYNVGIGHYTMGYNSWGGGFDTGHYNVAVGYYALHVPPYGTNNIAIGQYAFSREGNSNPPAPMTGSNNIAIGSNAGRYLNVVAGQNHMTGAENSIFIGALSRATGSGQTNQIIIGHDAVGHGSHTITLGNDEVTAVHCHVQTISALSDSRVKENIQAANLDNCLTAVKNLPVSEWDWLPIAGPHPDKHDIGFVSDDVAKVFPKAISKEDRLLTVRDAAGKPETTIVTEPVWQPPDADRAAPRTATRQIEKTMEIKGLQYVSSAAMLPTLWGAVQRLMQQVEALQAQLAGGTPEPPQQQNQKSGIFGSQKKR